MNQETATLVVPVYNAAATIGRCLRSIIEQDYPPDKVDIIVVDGISSDSTVAVVQDFVRECPRIKLRSNPMRRVPQALNIGIQESKADFVVFVGGRGGVLAPDFITKSVENLRKYKEAAVVGGVLSEGHETFMGKAIGHALRCPFGVSTAHYRYTKEPHFADTVGYGAYRREVFDEVGLTDGFMCNAVDDELNWRIIKAGHKILVNPEIQYTYFGRETIPALFEQYYGYGKGRAMAVKKHPDRFRAKHIIPTAFVLFLLLGLGLSLLISKVWIPYVSILGVYVVLSLFSSIRIAAREGWALLPILPVLFFVVHISYGLGFLREYIGGHRPPKPVETEEAG